MIGADLGITHVGAYRGGGNEEKHEGQEGGGVGFHGRLQKAGGAWEMYPGLYGTKSEKRRLLRRN